MMKTFEEFQKLGQANFDAAVQSMGEVNKGFQAIAAELTDYTKKAFEEGTSTMEKLLGAKTLDQAIEIQTAYAKKAYEAYIAEVSKLGEMYIDIARDAYKPVDAVVAKKA